MSNYRYLDLEGLTKYDNLLKTHIDDKLNKYLPLAGGTMSGNVDMGGHEFKNTNFELVESLPTENLYEGRQVTYDGKIYTYHNEKWISTADDLGDLKEILPSEFIFRPTADAYSVKDEFASVRNIKGNTVVLNQLSKPTLWDAGVGATATYDSTTGIHTLTTLESQYNRDLRINGAFIGNHKYMLKCNVKSNYDGNCRFLLAPSAIAVAHYLTNGSKKTIAGILTASENQQSLRIEVYTGTDAGKTLEIEDIQLIDLTQMFGEGNEPTVEEFEKLYSHLPTDYNEGSLLNLNADSIKSVGFNQWDEEWENGSLDYNGNVIPNLNSIVTSFIKVNPSEQYFYRIKQTTPIASDVAFFDENKNYVSFSTAFHINSVFTIPNNVHYIIICPSSTYGNIYNNDICINLSHNGERDGEYESYEEHIVNLPIKKYFPDGMKSAGTAYDEIVFDKNIGKYKAIQRIGSVDMGTLNWAYNSTYGGFICSTVFPSATGSNNIFKGLSAKYPYNGLYSGVEDKEMGFIYYTNVFIKDSSYSDAASFKQSLVGQILYYELAEPIETIIDDYDLIAYKANDWGTEEVLSEEDTAPIKADIEYNFDTMEMVRDNYFEVDKIKKGLNEHSPLTYEEISSIFGV